MTSAAGRIAALDSLRGWAAVYVVLYHTALIPSPALHVPGWAAPVVLNGGTGVTLFFVTSAFSLCRAARPGEDRGRELAAFAARRFFRIAPLFYAVLSVSLLRDWWVYSVVHRPGIIAMNAAFLFNLVPGQETGLVWASWTIGVEMLFYCGFPFLAARAKTVDQAMVAVLLALFAAMAYAALLPWTALPQAMQDAQAQNGVLRHLPVFIAGLLTYRIFERFVAAKSCPRAAGAALLLGAAYLYAALLRGWSGAGLFQDAYYWQAIVYSAIVLGATIYPAGLIVNRATLHLGKVSYSLYLIHPLVVWSLAPFYHSIEAQGWRSTTLSFATCAGATLTVAATLATLTQALIEVPGMRLGSRVTARLHRPLIAAAS